MVLTLRTARTTQYGLTRCLFQNLGNLKTPPHLLKSLFRGGALKRYFVWIFSIVSSVEWDVTWRGAPLYFFVNTATLILGARVKNATSQHGWFVHILPSQCGVLPVGNHRPFIHLASPSSIIRTHGRLLGSTSKEATTLWLLSGFCFLWRFHG